MLIAGLTGGIASGKSTVSAVLAEAGARVIDADAIAREAARKGTAAYADIVAHFGRGILLPDGEIDRRRLGDIVFNDPVEKKVIESFIHPWVREETARRLERIRGDEPNAVVILDVPLLFEAGMHHGLAEVIVVVVPEAVQLARLMARDRLAPAEALARIRSQMPIEHKKALATRVIDNSGSREHTRTQTLEVYRSLRLRSGNDPPEECRYRPSRRFDQALEYQAVKTVPAGGAEHPPQVGQAGNTQTRPPAVPGKPGELGTRRTHSRAARRVLETADLKHDAMGVGEGVTVGAVHGDTFLHPCDRVQAIAAENVRFRFRAFFLGNGAGGRGLIFRRRPPGRLPEAMQAIPGGCDHGSTAPSPPAFSGCSW